MSKERNHHFTYLAHIHILTTYNLCKYKYLEGTKNLLCTMYYLCELETHQYDGKHIQESKEIVTRL